jgi:hypothetical protein
MRKNGVASNGNRGVPNWWIDDIRRNGNAGAWDRIAIAVRLRELESTDSTFTSIQKTR